MAGDNQGDRVMPYSSADSLSRHMLTSILPGNDFSNLYGLRRPVDATVYSAGIVRDILVDILNVFARDYVVSGPVWEYFEDKKGNAWSEGLRQELELDRINGFIGKTAIHPSQLPYIYESLQVTRTDYEDARQLLRWDVDKLGVVKSVVKIFDLIAQYPDITRERLAREVGLSVRGVEKNLAQLKSEGKIVRVGGRKGGHWEVAKGTRSKE